MPPRKNYTGGNGAGLVSNGNSSSYSYSNGNGLKLTQSLSVVFAALSFVVSLGFGFYTVANPQGAVSALKFELREDMHREVSRLDDSIATLRNNFREKVLSKDEHVEFKNGIAEKTNNLREEINRIRADQVTRSEHQQHWTETGARIDAVRDLNVQLRKDMTDSIAALQKEVGGQYTVGDQIKNIQDQMKTLSARLDSLKTKQASASAP